MSAARQPSMRSPAGVAWGSVLVCMRRYRVERDTPVLALTCRRRKILSVSLSTIDMTLPLKVVLAGIGRNMRGIQAAIVVDTQTRPVDGKPRLELSGASRLCDSAGNYGQTCRSCQVWAHCAVHSSHGWTIRDGRRPEKRISRVMIFIKLRGKPRPSGRGGIARTAKLSQFLRLLSVELSLNIRSRRYAEPAGSGGAQCPAPPLWLTGC
jgi:hypothetical protein